MIVDAWVTTDDDPFSLTTSPYNIEGEAGVDFGQQSWRRNMATSPFVHGGFPVTQVLENSQATLAVQVKASDQDSLADSIAALIAAFSQFEYELHIKFDDTEWGWTCWAADVAVESHDERMAQFNTVVRFSIPRSPIGIVNGGI